MNFETVAISDRPDLAPLVATWLVRAFGYPGSRTVEQMTALVLSPQVGPEETFVLFDDGTPVGTASLAHEDLVSRPDLTPWLAGVVVDEAHRGRGCGTVLVRRVEAFAAELGVGTMWLYTWTAEALYARLGWRRTGLEMNRGREVVLMSRSLQTRGTPPA